MLKNMITTYNPWVLMDDSLLDFMNWKNWVVLFVSVLVLYGVSKKQEQGVSMKGLVDAQPVVVRYMIYICAIWCIWVFGVYGFGYDANAFIYGGF